MKLSIREQKQFIEDYKRKVVCGKTSVEQPEFVYFIGAKGSGKTTLARKLENTVLISADDVIADYIKVSGEDGRNFVYGQEERNFFAVVANEVFKEAIRNKYNIAYDTGLTDSTEKMIEIMQSKGYRTRISAVITDGVAAQLSVAERKLKYDHDFEDFKEKGADFPEGQNPTLVDLGLAAKSALDVICFLHDCKEDFEVFEIGKDQPVFSSKDRKITFDEYVDDFCSRIPSDDVYLRRLNRLSKQAEKQNNTLISSSLEVLKGKLQQKG